MRVFVTGASGWIGSATTTDLLAAGHQVVGLARSEAAAATVAGLGADVVRGSLDDLGSIADGAAGADAVVHLGYDHDFSRTAAAAQTDRQVIGTLGAALEGSGGTLLIASGTLGLAPGRVGTERDVPAPDGHPRMANAAAALALAERGVRPVVLRFAPTVHGTGDRGFVPYLVTTARERGVSAYVGDGASRWPAVHRSDAARLVRLAVEAAPAGAVLHAVAEEGVAARDIAEAIGRGLDLPVRSIPVERAAEHFGWMGTIFGADFPASHALTSELLGWQPTGPELLEDLAGPSYFRA